MNQAELPIIKLLVESGANLNASSSNGNTALHEAAINEKLEICKYLLESGANPTLRNNFGMSARDIAKKSACLNKPFERSYALHKKKEKTRAHHPMANYSDGSILADDLDTSMRPSRKASTSSTRSRNEKKFVVFGTGMEPQSKLKLAELAQRLSFEVAKEFGDNGWFTLGFNLRVKCNRIMQKKVSKSEINFYLYILYFLFSSYPCHLSYRE